jgi:hypothetical protein
MNIEVGTEVLNLELQGMTRMTFGAVPSVLKVSVQRMGRDQ